MNLGNTKHQSLLFEIEIDLPLGELDAQINKFCTYAEQQTTNIIFFCFRSCTSDLKPWPGHVTINHISKWERTVRRIERMKAITVCIIPVPIGGPALELLLATDYRVASNDFQLMMPVNDGQVWPGMSLHRLVNQIGQAWGRRLFLSSQEITAHHALAMGLIDEISEVTPEIFSVLDSRLGKMCGREISIRRQLLLEAQTTTFEDARGTYLAACERELRRLNTCGDFSELREFAE